MQGGQKVKALGEFACDLKPTQQAQVWNRRGFRSYPSAIHDLRGPQSVCQQVELFYRLSGVLAHDDFVALNGSG